MAHSCANDESAGPAFKITQRDISRIESVFYCFEGGTVEVSSDQKVCTRRHVRAALKRGKILRSPDLE